MAGYGRHCDSGEEERLLGDRSKKQTRKPSRRWTVASTAALLVILVLAAYLGIEYEPSRSVTTVSGTRLDGQVVPSFRPQATVQRPKTCSTVSGGHPCFDISHHWGQYSPYFSLAADSISGDVPEGCNITFVQVLSRHGARYPTDSKSEKYAKLVDDIQANATAFKGEASFLRHYNYTLGSDDLTIFGERQMVSSGIEFYQRYEALTRDHVPFIRASGSSRVVESGKKFIQGFQQTKKTDRHTDRKQTSPKINVVISEQSGFNNSLNHNTCPKFEASKLGDKISENYAAIFAPPIARRLETDLPGVQLSNDDIIHLMDMCAFDTVSSTPDGSKQSAFCHLFTESEWTQYNYLQSLGKYYGYGAGNPLGPTLGVGFVNELIARLTHTPVHDHTSTNHTLDSPCAATFPLNRALYADFTHDNGMIPIFFALGFYNGTAPLPRKHVQSASDSNGYSAAWTVPFAARAYIEMMQCSADPKLEPFVRVLVNDRVVPLHGCDVDELGRCRRDDFVRGLSFARGGGNWENCYS